jgi:hypothetical protein
MPFSVCTRARFRAARQAGLTEIPALVRDMTDEEALGAQLENLQRKDLHALDEADGLLRLKEVQKLGISDIAQRLAKSEQYVARRLALTNLIEEARDDLREHRITLAHALEICRLAPEVQARALNACYESKIVFDRIKQTNSYYCVTKSFNKFVKRLASDAVCALAAGAALEASHERYDQLFGMPSASVPDFRKPICIGSGNLTTTSRM